MKREHGFPIWLLVVVAIAVILGLVWDLYWSQL